MDNITSLVISVLFFFFGNKLQYEVTRLAIFISL